jgi:hypothetical protein
MRRFLKFVRELPGVQEMEERVAKELPSAIALSAEPRQEWVLSLWFADRKLNEMPVSGANENGNPLESWWESTKPGADVPFTDDTWAVLKDAGYKAVVSGWIQDRIRFPNLNYDRAPPSFQGEPKDRVLFRIVFPRFPRPAADELSRARDIIQQSAVPCVIEFRAKPDLALGAGSALIPPGTAGGLVRDGVGNVYAVTCGHVVSGLLGADVNDRRVRDRQEAVVGQVVQAVIPVRQPLGHICARPRLRAGDQPLPDDPFANLLDVALIELTDASPATGIGGIFADFDSGTTVQMSGAVSGAATYAVLDVNLWMKFPSNEPSETPICFQDLFRLGPLTEHWLGRTLLHLQGPRVAALTSTIPKRGDSGAWITSASVHGAPDWLGMLVAVDDNSGYALMSDTILDWLRRVLPEPVRVH